MSRNLFVAVPYDWPILSHWTRSSDTVSYGHGQVPIRLRYLDIPGKRHSHDDHHFLSDARLVDIESGCTGAQALNGSSRQGMINTKLSFKSALSYLPVS